MNSSSLATDEKIVLLPEHLVHAEPALGLAAASTMLADEALEWPLENPANALLKRGVDLVVSMLLIVLVLSWLTPLLALLIIIDSRGPVFFLQKRNRKNGGVFTCIKFRTMVVNGQADVQAASENDPRITRAGRLLRRTHLDELPQLLNVLWGQMSLIGPRPYMVRENLQYETSVPGYAIRNRVKPGITGLAQSLGHHGSLLDEQKMKERVEIDIEYVRNWSVAMDLQIAWRTLGMMMGRQRKK
jgi:putative colanic acid biosynthesis UDP-glucose lipid carrier transferase